MKSLVICLLYFATFNAFAETVVINGVKAEVTASSTLKSNVPDAYSIKNLFDDNPATAWVEGASGAGKGEWVKIEFENEVRLDGIIFEPGYRKSFETFRENAFPSQIAIYLDNSKASVKSDFRYLAMPGLDPEPGGWRFSENNSRLTFLTVLEGKKAKSILLKITSSVEGTKYKDMAISGITFITKGQSDFYQKLFEFNSDRDQSKNFWKNDYMLEKPKDKCAPFTKANPKSDEKYHEVKKLLDYSTFYKQMFSGSSNYSLLQLPCKNSSVLVFGEIKYSIDIESDNIARGEGLYYQFLPVFIYRNTDGSIHQKGIAIDSGFPDDAVDTNFPILPMGSFIFE